MAPDWRVCHVRLTVDTCDVREAFVVPCRPGLLSWSVLGSWRIIGWVRVAGDLVCT